jgi:deoxyribodipyrimidine photo-lyase
MTDLKKPVIVWFRQDLRLADNPALQAAAATGAPVLPVYILDDDAPGAWKPGGASRWWLHHSLSSLAHDIEQLGGRLIVQQGPAQSCLDAIIEKPARRPCSGTGSTSPGPASAMKPSNQR